MSLAKEIKARKINTVRHEALLNIMRTADMVERIGYDFFNGFGITAAQYNLLIVLKLEGKNLTQVEIGERLIASRANVTALVDRLENKGYVKRSDVKGDRRAYYVGLTSKGRELLEQVEPKYLELVEKNMNCLSASQSRQLSSMLSGLRGKLSKF